MCVCVVTLCVCFFFYKQKTAYEMRISDWSSDVCSSDLNYIEAAAHIAVGEGLAPIVVDEEDRGKRGLGGPVDIGLDAIVVHPEIGRASCRERVCQYV